MADSENWDGRAWGTSTSRKFSEVIDNRPLRIRTLLLSDGERIIAFSMGSRMNRDYYDVGFEKAFPDVNGAYAMINREFSRMIAEKYPEVQFLNREDDMGSEGLRRAKESYQPTVLLEKYVADWKEN